MSIKNIHFILVRPQLGENIGSVARAIKNFNITKLRIVNPRCVWPNDKALATSVGAKDILKKSKVFNSIDSSIADLDIVFASTSRIRKVNKKIIPILDLSKSIKRKKKIGILFGPEASGLSNDELNSADYLVKIPTNKNFSSLNLSHSAIIFSFQIFQHFLKKKQHTNHLTKAHLQQKTKLISFLILLLMVWIKRVFYSQITKEEA